MAIYHCSIKPISRSAGRSATAAAAYRSGTRIIDERTGEIHDYTRRSGVEGTELVLPENVTAALGRPEVWNSAEAAERRKDARVAREVEIALPNELTADQRRELAINFARQIAERYNVAADVCIHQPGKEGDQRNHHAHILLTTRQITPDGSLGAKSDLELEDKALKAAGKPTGRQQVEALRETWATMCNQALERAGHSERIDHRTLKAQGIEREATVHQGPTVTEIERKHVAAVIQREHEDQRLEHIISLDEYTQQRRTDGNIPAITRIGELNQTIREIERLEAKRPKAKQPQTARTVETDRELEREIATTPTPAPEPPPTTEQAQERPTAPHNINNIFGGPTAHQQDQPPAPQPRPSPPQQPVMPVPAQTQTPQGAEYPSEPQTPEQQRADAALRDMLMALARRASMIDGWGDNNPHYRAAPTMLRSIIHDVLQQPRDERERYINDVVLRDEQRDTLPDYIALYQRNVVADGIIPVGKPATVQATHQAAQTAALPPEPPQTPPAVETGRELEREITATTPTPAPESQQQQPNQPELDEEMNDDLEEEPERPIQRPHSKPYASPTPAAPTAAPQPVMPVPPQTQAPPEPETQETPTKAQPEMPTPAIPPEQTARDARLQAAIRAEEDWDRQQATAVPPADLEEAIRRARRGALIRYHADLARQGEEAPYGTRAEQAIIAAAEDRAWEAWSQAQERPAAALDAADQAADHEIKRDASMPPPQENLIERQLIDMAGVLLRGGREAKPHFQVLPNVLRRMMYDVGFDVSTKQVRNYKEGIKQAAAAHSTETLVAAIAKYAAAATAAGLQPLGKPAVVVALHKPPPQAPEADAAATHKEAGADRSTPAVRTRDRGWGR